MRKMEVMPYKKRPTKGTRSTIIDKIKKKMQEIKDLKAKQGFIDSKKSTEAYKQKMR